MSQEEPGFGAKVLFGSLNALERYLFSENFVVSNLTPFDEIYRDGIMSVRHYRPLTDETIMLGEETVAVQPLKHRVPLLLVPPLGATSMIFDLMPQRSLVRFFLAQGFDVYLVDWGDVTEDHSHLSLANYVLDWMPKVVDAVTQRSGQQEVSCFCYCMGGLLTLMYAASHEDSRIANLVTVASPIDFHQSGLAGRALSLVYRPAQMVSRLLNISLLDLPSRYLHVPGWLNSLAFKLTNPAGSVISSLDLLVNYWDRDYVKQHTSMSQWFDGMVDYPGEIIKEMVVHMGLDNRMAGGAIPLGGKRAEFSNVRCSLLAYAGSSDKLVSPSAARQVLEIVASEDKSFSVVSGGHAGVFAGSRAPEEVWSSSADWLAARSD